MENQGSAGAAKVARMYRCPHDLGLQPGPAEGLGAAQVAQLEASIREAERDVRGLDGEVA